MGAPYPFIADARAEIIKRFGIKLPLVKLAKRVSFVIDSDMTILHIDSGKDALDPTKALSAC